MQDPAAGSGDKPPLSSSSPVLQRLLSCASSWHNEDHALDDASVDIEQTAYHVIPIDSDIETKSFYDFRFDLTGCLEFVRANYKRLGLHREFDQSASKTQSILRSAEFMLQKQDLDIELWSRLLEKIEKSHFLRIAQDAVDSTMDRTGRSQTLSRTPFTVEIISNSPTCVSKNAISEHTKTQVMSAWMGSIKNPGISICFRDAFSCCPDDCSIDLTQKLIIRASETRTHFTGLTEKSRAWLLHRSETTDRFRPPPKHPVDTFDLHMSITPLDVSPQDRYPIPDVFEERTVRSRLQSAGKNVIFESTQTRGRGPDASTDPTIRGRFRGADRIIPLKGRAPTSASRSMLQSGSGPTSWPPGQDAAPGHTGTQGPRDQTNDAGQGRKFFKLGKTFIWLRGAAFSGNEGQDPSGGRHKVRRFLVVRESADVFTALAINTHSGQGVQARHPDIFKEPTIKGRLQDVDVTVFPDTGAAANFISLSYAQSRGLAVDENFKSSVKVGSGGEVPIVGTTSLQFSFTGEPETHSLTFHVLRQSIHDIILGSAFLHASQTFTRFAHRVETKIRKAVSSGIRRISFLGSQQYVNGLANGVRVDAVPDTGADVCVMSARFASANGFEIDDAEQHRISLQFADGSKARARGVVRDVAWRFGVDDQTHPTDIYVLSTLPVDLVLGYGFLCQTKAFLQHGDDFRHVEDHEQEDTWRLCVIRVLKRAMKAAGMNYSCEYRFGVRCLASRDRHLT
jgi:hypothetical protein